MLKKITYFVCFFSLLSLWSCGGGIKLWGFGGDKNYQGPEYAPVTRTTVIFHPNQAQETCQVFAHALVALPASFSGREISHAILTEGNARGADRILVGQSRQSNGGKDVQFLYYGPEEEYSCIEQWNGWKFGYDLWEKQGEWVSIGYKEWGQDSFRPEVPVLMQIAMMRCR